MKITRTLATSSLAGLAIAVIVVGCGAPSANPTGAAGGTPAAASTATTPTASAVADPDGGEPGGTGAQGGGPSACINTAEEVSEAFGVRVTEAENTAAGDGASCLYHIDKDAFASAMATTLTIGQLGVDIAIQSFIEAEGFEEVAGIGDRAGWFAPGGLFIIVKGDRFLTMVAGASGTTDPAVARTALEALARLGVDNL